MTTDAYTVYVAYGPLDVMGKPTDETSIEEIDVEARSYAEADRLAAEVLARDYDPGGVILHSKTFKRPRGFITY